MQIQERGSGRGYRPLATKCILTEFFSMENAFDVEYIGIIQKAIKNEQNNAIFSSVFSSHNIAHQN